MLLLGGKAPSPPFLGFILRATHVFSQGVRAAASGCCAWAARRVGVPTRKSLSGGAGEGGIRSLLFPGWDPGSLRSPRPQPLPGLRSIPARAPRCRSATAPQPLASPLCLLKRSALPNSPPSVKEP